MFKPSLLRSILMMVALCAFFAFFSTACDSGDDDASRGVPVYDDDDIDDDFDDFDDDGDDDNDDDEDDDADDDTVPPDQIDHVQLTFDPDPYANDAFFYSGQEFTMTVSLYNADDEFLAKTSEYTLSVSSTPETAPYELDMDTETIALNPTRPTLYLMTASLDIVDIDSNLVEVFVQIENSALITLTSPTRGLFTQGGSVNVEGTCLIDTGDRENVLTPCQKIEINEFSIIDINFEGHFTFQVGLGNGLNRIVVQALGESDAVLAEVRVSVLKCDNPLPDGAMIESAVGARINDGGFNTIEDIAVDLISGIDLLEYVPNPLIDETIEFLGQVLSISLNVTDFTYEDIQIDLGPDQSDSFLKLEVHIINFALTLQGDGTLFDILCDGNNTGVLTAADLSLTAFVDIYVEPMDGQLVVDIDGIEIGGLDTANLSGFGDTCDGILNTLITNDLLAPLLEEMIADLLDDELQPMLEDLLGDLVLAGSFDLLSQTFNLAADFQQIFLHQGGLSIWMDANFAAEEIDPTVPVMPGSYRIAGDRPVMGAGLPPDDLVPYGFGVALDDDIVNQVLYEIFRSGVLGMDITDESLTVTTIAALLFTPQLLFHPDFNADDPVILRLEPLLQPIISLESGTGFNAGLAMGEYMLHVVVDTDAGEVTILSAAITLVFPVGITIDEQGLLFIEIDPEDFEVDLTVWYEYQDLSFNSVIVERLIPDLLEGLIPMLGDLLGGIAIPSFEGYTLSIDSLAVVGERSDYIGMYGSLTSIAE